MRFYDRRLAVDLADARPQVADQLFETFELLPRGQVAVEIADEADAERDVVEIIAVDVAAVDLPHPAVADLDFAVAARGAVADDEMVREPVLHFAYVLVVIIERLRIAL